MSGAQSSMSHPQEKSTASLSASPPLLLEKGGRPTHHVKNVRCDHRYWQHQPYQSTYLRLHGSASFVFSSHWPGSRNDWSVFKLSLETHLYLPRQVFRATNLHPQRQRSTTRARQPNSLTIEIHLVPPAHHTPLAEAGLYDGHPPSKLRLAKLWKWWHIFLQPRFLRPSQVKRQLDILAKWQLDPQYMITHSSRAFIIKMNVCHDHLSDDDVDDDMARQEV